MAHFQYANMFFLSDSGVLIMIFTLKILKNEMKCIVREKRTYASSLQQILLCLWLKLIGQYSKEDKPEPVLSVEEAVAKR